MHQQILVRQSELTILINGRDKLKRVHASYVEQLEDTDEKVKRLRSQLTKEQQDVQKLEQFSLPNLVNKWNGTMNEERRKEIEEAVEVEL